MEELKILPSHQWDLPNGNGQSILWSTEIPELRCPSDHSSGSIPYRDPPRSRQLLSPAGIAGEQVDWFGQGSTQSCHPILNFASAESPVQHRPTTRLAPLLLGELQIVVASPFCVCSVITAGPCFGYSSAARRQRSRVVSNAHLRNRFRKSCDNVRTVVCRGSR